MKFVNLLQRALLAAVAIGGFAILIGDWDVLSALPPGQTSLLPVEAIALFGYCLILAFSWPAYRSCGRAITRLVGLSFLEVAAFSTAWMLLFNRSPLRSSLVVAMAICIIAVIVRQGQVLMIVLDWEKHQFEFIARRLNESYGYSRGKPVRKIGNRVENLTYPFEFTDRFGRIHHLTREGKWAQIEIACLTPLVRLPTPTPNGLQN